MQEEQRAINVKHQQKRKLDEESVRTRALVALQVGTKAGTFPKPKPAYEGLGPKSKGPRPTSSTDNVAKPAGCPPNISTLPAGSPPTGGTSRGVAAPAIRVPMSKSQASPISLPTPMITSNPAENPLIAALANTAGQESSNAPRLTEGVAYHPGPSASVNPTIAKSGSSSHLPVQLAAGVET